MPTFKVFAGAASAYAPAIVLFLFEASDLMLLLPKIRLLESRICQEHYGSKFLSLIAYASEDIDKTLCKIPVIQARLALIRGWQVFLDVIPSTPLC
jgi:hypothetical protein